MVDGVRGCEVFLYDIRFLLGRMIARTHGSESIGKAVVRQATDHTQAHNDKKKPRQLCQGKCQSVENNMNMNVNVNANVS